MRNLILIFCGVFCSLTALHAKDPALYLYQVDALDKVFKDRRYFVDEIDTLAVARGEYATLQVVIKSNREIKGMRAYVESVAGGAGEIEGAQTGWVGYVRAGRKYQPTSKDLLRTPSDYFPDPILTDVEMDMEVNDVQPVWVTVPIARDTEPGLYKGRLVIEGQVDRKKQSWSKDFYVRVFPVTIEETSLLVSNWSAHTSPVTLSYLNGMAPVELYSDLYWELIGVHARMMVSHKQNVLRIFPSWHVLATYDNGKYTFDFSRFDREVELFDAVGETPLKRIEGGHLAWRSGAWDEPFHVEILLPDNEETRKYKGTAAPNKVENGLRRVILPITDPRTKNYLDQYLPALKAHLEEKGWYGRYMQHIADEPTARNAPSYGAISEYVKKHLPGVPVFDAVLTSRELAGTIDVWVPVLDVIHRDWKFYQDLKKQGKEIWFYTCVGPRGNYANRFLEQPLVQTRILHWINYKYGLVGYLHWGLNFWGSDPLTSDASRDRGKLPAGDANITYPGYRKLYSSIRLEAMRDGIYDYELLKMLERKNPAKAREYINAIVMNFDNYDSNFSYFKRVRRGILIYLSQTDATLNAVRGMDAHSMND